MFVELFEIALGFVALALIGYVIYNDMKGGE